MSKYLGVFIIVMALAIAIVPSFTDCSSQGKFMTLMSGMKAPMVCHWTAQAAIATGVPLVAVGAIMTTARRKSSLFALSIMGTVLGIFAILLPTSLIGVCTNMTSLCNTTMKPAMMVLGGLTIAGSLGGMVLMRKAKS
jgi:hypothetical protein